jgi:hypothetical protein
VRGEDCRRTLVRSNQAFATLGATLGAIATGSVSPDAPILDSLESGLFALAPGVAACPTDLARYVEFYERMRKSSNGSRAIGT